MKARDVDLLLLIREEAVYAKRIRDALVFSEDRIERPPVASTEMRQRESEVRRALYVRPTSMAERLDDGEDDILLGKSSKVTVIKRKGCDTATTIALPLLQPFVNPPIDRRRTVADNDALHSRESAEHGRLEFSYADLVAVLKGEKTIVSRALRRLANLWDINNKLRKSEMLARLLGEYVRRYPDEVAEYEKREAASTSQTKRRPPRRRRHHGRAVVVVRKRR